MSGFGEAARGVQFFPLSNEVTDLPHQRLMLVDDRLRGEAVAVKAGSRHLLLDVANGSFARSNARFELTDFRAPRLVGPCAPAEVGIGALLILVPALLAFSRCPFILIRAGLTPAR